MRSAVIIAICVIAAGTGGYFGFDYYRQHRSGRFGKTLEICVAAIDAGQLSKFDDVIVGKDVFSAEDAERIRASEIPPPGWLWVPVDKIFGDRTGPFIRRGKPLGQVSLLVLDHPAESLKHGSGLPAWGVKSAKVVDEHFDRYTDVRTSVELDDAGGKLIEDLSGRYIKHYLAVEIDGRVVMAPKVKSQIPGRFEISSGGATVDDSLPANVREEQLGRLRKEAQPMVDRLLAQ